MPITNTRNVLQAIRAGFQATSDPIIKQTLRATARVLRDEDPTSQQDDIRDALVYLRQPIAALEAAGDGAVMQQIAVLVRAYPTLPEDDPAPNVIDQKKVRNRIRQVMTDPACPAWLVARCQDVKRRLLGDYQQTDPVETVLAAALTDLQAATTLESVIAALAVVQQNQHLIPEPAQ